MASNSHDTSNTEGPSRKTILVVEDHEPIRSAIVGLLAALGYVVVTAVNGAEALSVLNTIKHIDLVLTDVSMPCLGGVAMADVARSLRPSVPVAFMSGHVENPEDRRAIDALGAVFLQKPFTHAELEEAVDRALSRA